VAAYQVINYPWKAGRRGMDIDGNGGEKKGSYVSV